MKVHDTINHSNRAQHAVASDEVEQSYGKRLRRHHAFITVHLDFSTDTSRS
jgi:hypothetical protein